MQENEKIKEKLNEENRKKRILFIILMILIFLFFIIMYFIGYRLGKIDIIPIVNDGKYYEEEEKKELHKESINKNYHKKVNKDTEKCSNNEENTVDTVTITEDNLNWNVEEKLNIFSNPQFSYNLIVAPSSQYYYQFIVKNETDKPINYDVMFIEKNEYLINLKYKLKLDNEYIIGNVEEWKSVEDLNLKDILLAGNSKNLYILEWKWVEQSEEKDNLAAGNEYEMLININANQK